MFLGNPNNFYWTNLQVVRELYKLKRFKKGIFIALLNLIKGHNMEMIFILFLSALITVYPLKKIDDYIFRNKIKE